MLEIIIASVIGILLTFLSVYLLRTDCVRKMQETMTNERIFNSSSVCTRPECVRCSKSTAVLDLSMRKYEKMIKECKRDVAAFHRIDASYENYTIYQSCGETKKSLSRHLETKEPQQNPVVYNLPYLFSKRWWDEDDVNLDTTSLKKNFNVILDDFKCLYERINNSKHWTVNMTSNGRWSVCSIVNQGIPNPENIKYCSNTMNVVMSLSTYMSKCVFGNVLFSVLYPGTKIEEHCGPSNIRLRAHLGLVVPQSRHCFITVGGESRHWTEGGVLIFDDSYVHSVKYDDVLTRSQSGTPDTVDKYKNARYLPQKHNEKSFINKHHVEDPKPFFDDQIRAVLMIDLWHPNLTPTEQFMLGCMFSSDY